MKKSAVNVRGATFKFLQQQLEKSTVEDILAAVRCPKETLLWNLACLEREGLVKTTRQRGVNYYQIK